MSEGANAQSLRGVLEELKRTSQSLHDCLLAEREALSQHNLNTLNRHTEAKKELLLRLEALEVQRRQLQQSMGFDPAADLIVPELDALWQEVLGSLRDCREANEINGVIVRTHHSQTQRALDLLAGRAGRDTVYDAHGLPSTRGRSGEIAKA